jgi:hypothetical protein
LDGVRIRLAGAPLRLLGSDAAVLEPTQEVPPVESMPHLRRMTSATRRPVQRSVAKPNDFGLLRNQPSTWL